MDGLYVIEERDKSAQNDFFYFLIELKKMDSEEQHKTALCYYNGDGVEKDFNQAIKWWTLSANQGNAVSQYNLGVCYYNGDGIKKDMDQSIKWWTLSAIQGNANAQHSLGVRYYNGDGVKKDFNQAVKWFTLSANQGNAKAQKNLTNLKITYVKDSKTSVPHEQCSICLDNKKCIVFTCGHLCSCNSCSVELTTCPLCKVKITGRQLVYI